MSTPSRGRGGTATPRGTSSTPRGRGVYRGNASNTSRGRGRGRGSSSVSNTPTNNAGGLLQKIRTGSVQGNAEDSAPVNSRGRGASIRGQSGNATRARGSLSKTFNAPRQPRVTPPSRPSSPAPPTSHRDFMAQMNETFQLLKPKRDAERKKAIQDGFLADPEKKTSLANAITPVGTCTDLCPQFERVERIVQNMVDRAEKVPNAATGRDMPSESRMVKRFRRSAAGYDEQLPSDIRTPETLKRTLDYLLDKIIGGGERLAVVHKFVWDRTRGIRNDFSIQQVTKKEDVKIAVDCYERIARFHILSLHQLSNPVNLQEGEHFDAHQEREQLNNTLLSLMYYYDDNRGIIPLPNEPEFRAYCILFELQALTPDIEDRMQAWPVDLLNHPKVQTAFRLYAAAANTIMDQGPLRPLTPFSTAQANSAKFWTLLSSHAVSYIMACVCEMNFSMVRFVALDALWRSAKSAPQGQQARNQDWTLSELQNYLAFDEEDETLEFCQAFDLAFKNSDHGEQCLDFTAVSASTLDKSSLPSQQIFSHGIVEEKRYRRTVVAVINGVSVASAIRQGLVLESGNDDEEPQERNTSEDDQTMFIPEIAAASSPQSVSGFGSPLNPAATSFSPSGSFGQSPFSTPTQVPAFGQGFGNNASNPADMILWSGSKDSPVSPSADQFVAAPQPTNTSQIQSGSKSIFGQTLSPGPSFTGFGQANLLQPAASSPAATATTQDQPFQSIFGQNAPKPQPAASSIPIFGTMGSVKDTAQSPSEKSAFGAQQKLPEPSTTSFQSIFNQPSSKATSDGIQPALVPAASTSTGSGFVFNQPKQLQSEQSPQISAAEPPSTGVPQQDPSTVQKPQSGFNFFTNPQQPTVSTSSQPTEQSKSIFTATAPFGSTQDSTNSANVPTFSFTQQTSKVNDKQKESEQIFKFPSLPISEPSTTPQGTPKKPQSGIFQFAPRQDREVSPGYKGNQQVSAPKLQPEVETDSAPAFQSNSVTARSLSPSPPPSTPKFTEDDREQLVKNTARLILTQQQGLVEYFVSHHVSNLLQPLFQRYRQERLDEAMSYIRTNHLSRKFSSIWREKTRKNVLDRRAKQRRKLLRAAMLAEQERKQRDEMELEAILAATQETRRLQQEQKALHQHTLDQNTIAEQPSRKHDASTVGQKRKTTSNNSSPRTAPQVAQHNGSTHKRSRTVGTFSEPYMSLRLSTSAPRFRLSSSGFGTSRFDQSALGRSMNSTISRKPVSQKVDSTKTDYFKMKALGIDPNTPLIPDTAKDLERKRREKEEAREALLARSRLRSNNFAASTTSRTSSPTVSSPPNQAVNSVAYLQLPSKDVQSTNFTVDTSHDEDPLLRQLREARQTLAQDADWFRNQSATLEKEIEQHEDMRRSQLVHNHVPTRPESPHVPPDGIAKTNGYEYYQSSPKFGKTLSRTEERIRRTGAHGLATKPTGRAYIPVAMSRQSALRYSYGVDDTTATTGKKRGREEMNNSPESGRNWSLNISMSPATKRTREETGKNKARANPSFTKASTNAFAALQNNDGDEDDEDDEDEDEEEGEEDEGDIEEDTDHNYYHQNGGDDGDTEDNGNDDLYDEEEEDEEDEDEYGEDNSNNQHQYQNHHNHFAHQYPLLRNMPSEERLYDDDDGDEDEDNTTGTYPQYSRAQSRSSAGVQSGPGASADDAVVLSD